MGLYNSAALNPAENLRLKMKSPNAVYYYKDSELAKLLYMKCSQPDN